jgi:prolyl-tRNA synthetase
MHRWSQLFIPTLREAPADAEVASHKLLLRAGYIRQLGAGIYSYLFLGNRAINKIVAIVRQEMDTIGQEFYLPALNPMEVWAESGRWAGMGDTMFRLKDRKGAELCLAMTHEEVMTTIARSELRSYKQLPQIWYQIQTKFRDEPRPKSGLLRVRQFLMKDAYSFDIDEAGLDASYAKHDQVYHNIFSRCGLDAIGVEADSGSMGGSESKEFMVFTDAGEDFIARCSYCNYAANVEKAVSKLPLVADLEPIGDGMPKEIPTPNQFTIEEVVSHLKLQSASIPELQNVNAGHLIKTLGYMANGWSERYKENIWRIVVILLRGDQHLNETKLRNVIDGFVDMRPMNAEELFLTFEASAGSLGPLGLKRALMDRGGGRSDLIEPLVILDESLRGRSNLIAGANKDGYHLLNLTPDRDFPTKYFFDLGYENKWEDTREVNENDPCPNCVEGTLHRGKAVEIGHIFKLGRKYTASMGATVLNRDGKETTPIMGSYGIGIERILTAAIEQSAAKFAAQQANDPKATETYALPPSIAPFQVVVTITNVREAELLAAGEKIAADLTAAGIDVLLDDRDERAGVKFKDAELIGVPFRIAIGKKLAEGKVELLNRLTNRTDDIPTAESVQHLRAALALATN